MLVGSRSCMTASDDLTNASAPSSPRTSTMGALSEGIGLRRSRRSARSGVREADPASQPQPQRSATMHRVFARACLLIILSAVTRSQASRLDGYNACDILLLQFAVLSYRPWTEGTWPNTNKLLTRNHSLVGQISVSVRVIRIYE